MMRIVFQFIHRHLRSLLFFTVGFSLLLMLKMLSTVHTTSIATVDVTGLIHQFIQDQKALHLSEIALKQHVSAFGKELESTLKIIAKKHHVILMPQEAVVAGAVDMTPLIKEKLNLSDTSPHDTSPNALW